MFKLTSSWPPARVEVGVRAAVDDTRLAGNPGNGGNPGNPGNGGNGGVFQSGVSFEAVLKNSEMCTSEKCTSEISDVHI